MSDLVDTYMTFEKALDAYLQLLKDLRELHQLFELTKIDDPANTYRLCGHCKVEWPCATMKVLGHTLGL